MVLEFRNQLTALRFHLTLVRMTVIRKTINGGEVVDKMDPTHAGKSSCYGNQLLKTAKIEPPYDPAAPAWVFIPKLLSLCRATFTVVLTEAGLTTAKLWNQSRCPTTEKCI